MTHAERLQAVTEAIAKAVPEIEERSFEASAVESGRTITCRDDRITLEDVLRAIQKEKRFGSSTETYLDLCDVGFEFGFTGTTNWSMWDLGKPLSQQSEEMIAFLHSLLCQ